METKSTEMEKSIYLIEVIIEISQEVETSSPEVEKGIYLVEGNNLYFSVSGNEFPESRKKYLPVNR